MTSTFKGVETNRMLAGKWLISDFKGEMFGSTFERGMAPAATMPKRTSTSPPRVHTMSVRIDTLEGTHDDKTKSNSRKSSVATSWRVC